MEILGCRLPEDRLYDLENEVWWAADPAGEGGRLGLLATLGAFAGPFRGFRFRPLDGRVGRGRSVGTVESVRYVGAVRAPFDARVLERNERVCAHPRLLNDAPYTDGWVVRLSPDRREDPARFLEPAPAIASRLEERIRSRRIRCWPTTPEVELIEIGLECSAVLTQLNEELARRASGEALLLVTDDPTSPIEMVRWSDQTGHPILAERREENLYQFLVRKEATPVPRSRRA